MTWNSQTNKTQIELPICRSALLIYTYTRILVHMYEYSQVTPSEVTNCCSCGCLRMTD